MNTKPKIVTKSQIRYVTNKELSMSIATWFSIITFFSHFLFFSFFDLFWLIFSTSSFLHIWIVLGIVKKKIGIMIALPYVGQCLSKICFDLQLNEWATKFKKNTERKEISTQLLFYYVCIECDVNLHAKERNLREIEQKEAFFMVFFFAENQSHISDRERAR